MTRILYEESVLSGSRYRNLAVNRLVKVYLLSLPVEPGIYMIKDRAVKHVLLIKSPAGSAAFTPEPVSFCSGCEFGIAYGALVKNSVKALSRSLGLILNVGEKLVLIVSKGLRQA